MKCQTLKLLSLSLVLVGLGISFGHAYSFDSLKDDFIKDTKEIFLKDLTVTANYDFLEKDFTKRIKFGLQTGLIAYKFISVEPIALYTPSSADQIAEGGLAFPIRLSRIPIGGSNELGDLFDKRGKDERSNDPTLLDRVSIGLYLAQNLTSGKFGFGGNLGIKW